MKTPLILLCGTTLGLLRDDPLRFAPPADEPLWLRSEFELSASFDAGSIRIGGNELPPEAVIQDYDEANMGGELALALQLRAVREAPDRRALWLEELERDGEPLDALAGLEVGQGMRFREADGSWSGSAIDAEGEPLETDAPHALSGEALLEALLGDGEAAVDETWELALTPAEALGLLFPGVGFAGLADLLPESEPDEDSDEPGLGAALRTSSVELLEGMDAELVVDCRYASREGDLARIEFSGEWSLTLDLSGPFGEAVRVGGEGDDGASPELSAEALIELEPSGALVWDVARHVPVEHALEADWSLELLIDALASMGEAEVPITAEFAWEGTLVTSSALED